MSDDEQFQKGYTAGYGAGYENGYSEGQTAGSDLKLAPWLDKKIRVTHAENCWSWGPAHYECACRELAKAKGWAK